MKKSIFIVLSVILGIVLSFLIHAIVEILYLNWAIKTNSPIVWLSVFGQEEQCALPFWLIYSLLLLGVIFGFVLVFIFGKNKIRNNKLKRKDDKR